MKPFTRFKFRTRLLATYLILVTLPLASLGTIFYFLSLDRMSDLSSKHAFEIIRKTNEIADLRFKAVRESSLSLVTDKDFFNVISHLNPKSNIDLLTADRSLTNLLNKYFLANNDLFSFQLYTSYYIFGSSNPYGNAYNTELYPQAVEAGGRTRWVPTYSVAKMYHQQELNKTSDGYLFSAVMQMNGFYVENGVADSMNPSVESPVLVVNYQEGFFRRLFENSIPLEGISYYVVSNDGTVVSHNQGDRLATTISDSWVKAVLKQKSGTLKAKIDGNDMIVCFDTSQVTGWTSIIIIPSMELIKEFAPIIRNSAISIGIVLFVVSLVLAYFMSGRIVDPLKKLLAAIKLVGNGNFSSKIAVGRNEEFGIVITKFNEMNDKIQDLIRENYEVKLREKEAEIMSLNVQLNPHFLYNTLNIMNWIAIENEQKQLSKMLVSLSSMLHYTTQNFKETGSLQEELAWLEHYLFIMSERFEGKFTVYYEITDELYGFRVPRLFLHPIVENAILHGFGSMTKGGIITISGYMENGERWFTVADNGRGLDHTKLSQMMHPASEHNGLKNVDTRIKLLYGPDFGLQIRSIPGEGTEVIVHLPGNITK